MNEILKFGLKRFVKGLREGPRRFIAPAVVAWRGLKFVFNQIETAMDEANNEPTPTSLTARSQQTCAEK